MMLFALMTGTAAFAQRTVDKIDRGLVAVKTTSGVFCSWRILGEEYYDVTYNIYRDGTKLNAQPLTVSNYTDRSGTTSSKYTVEAVVRGTAQQASAAVTPLANAWLEIKPDHGKLSGTFVPNDATAADLDGDGQPELIVKFDHANTGDDTYTVIEAYKLTGEKLWWINCGRNMGDFQNNEINIAAYDWDLDGKAECVMRAADGTIIHTADGEKITIGDASKNYRPYESGQWFVHEGAEYLLYMEGATAKPYQIGPSSHPNYIDYPLRRLEADESNLEKAWGDGYGHRSSKYFFGAPYLDGKKPSIFLARGIYTRHKMIAYDVDAATHQLTTRWTWNNNTPGSWYGQGYHNYIVADVDWDGRDEIVFGSMTIDDNGKGLATTGLGHGDAQHVSDFDPYRHGQEFFGCNEDHPGNNLCDATTRKILYRFTAGNDDGRAIMGNFSNEFPGCQGVSARDPNLISSVAYSGLAEGTKNHIAQNFRIYWDGDLCEESFNGSGSYNTEGIIIKYGSGVIANLTGSLTNNHTKATPCLQADLFGDWREEVVMRTEDNNIRIYTTTTPTTWRNYTLWHDHQYRNAIVWQMNGYNQPPHVSYFLGELEGITIAPPPLINTGRVEVANNGTIGSEGNGQHLLLSETNDMNVTVADGAAPYILTDYAPSWTQGSGNSSNITTVTYTHTLTGGALTGEMRLVKQGDGTLIMPAANHTYTGNTDVWAGTLVSNGTIENSRVWLNRHTTLITEGGTFKKGIQADYNATILPGNDGTIGQLATDSLILNFGAVVAFDLDAATRQADAVNATVIQVEKKNWKYGPAYATPVFRLNLMNANDTDANGEGKYLLGEVKDIKGSLDDILIEGVNNMKCALSHENGKLYVTLTTYQAGAVVWTGESDSKWDVDVTANFESVESGDKRAFVPGDAVIFDDNASSTLVTISGKVAPSSVVFNNNSKTYYLNGDSIVGNATLAIKGTGKVNINNDNRFAVTDITNGKLYVKTLANSIGQDYGALGGTAAKINITNNAVLGISDNVTTSQTITVGEGGATIEVASGKTLTMSTGIKQSGSNRVLTKTGAGTLALGSNNTVSKLVIKQGTVTDIIDGGYNQLPVTVAFEGGTLSDSNSEGMPGNTNKANFVVEEGKTGTLICDPRCDYTGKLTGKGTFTVNAAGVRNYFKGDWSGFEGTLIPGYQKRGSYDPSFDFNNAYGLPKATLKLNADVTFNNNGNAVTIGKVQGTGTLAGTGTYYIGDDNEDLIFTAYSNSKIVKRGEGTMKLLNLGRIKAALEIKAGTLTFNQSSLADLVIGTNQLTVNGSGKVMGQGLLSSVSVASGGTLAPRSLYSETNPGTIKVNGLASVAAGATADFLISNSKNSQMQTKYITLNGTVKVSLTDDFEPKAGTSYTLWTASASFSGTPKVSLPELPAGFAWDDSELLTKEGVLKITATDGIQQIGDSQEVVCEVYSLTGQKLQTFTARKSDITQRLSAQLRSSTYLVKMRADHQTEVRKVTIRK